MEKIKAALQERKQQLEELRDGTSAEQRAQPRWTYSEKAYQERYLENEIASLENSLEHFENRDPEQDSLFEAWKEGKLGSSVTLCATDRQDSTDCTVPYNRWSTVHDPEQIGEEESADTITWLLVEYATGSDYVGGNVHRSNFRTLKRILESSESLTPEQDWKEISGGHGTYGLLVRLHTYCSDTVEALQALERYPCLDEEDLYELESELERDAWESRYREEFKRELEKLHELDLSEASEESVDSLAWGTFRDGSASWEHSSEGAYLDAEALAESVTREQALGIEGASENSEILEQRESLQAGIRQALDALSKAPIEDPRGDIEALEESTESASVALGKPSSKSVDSMLDYLSQIARFPISEKPEQDSVAELASLRRYVGNVVHAARSILSKIDPEAYKALLERPLDPIPEETSKSVLDAYKIQEPSEGGAK